MVFKERLHEALSAIVRLTRVVLGHRLESMTSDVFSSGIDSVILCFFYPKTGNFGIASALRGPTERPPPLPASGMRALL